MTGAKSRESVQCILFKNYRMVIGIVKIGTGLVALEEFRKATNEAEAVAQFCNEYTPALNIADYLGVNAESVDRGQLWGWDFSEPTPALKEIIYILNTPAPVDLDTYKTEIINELIDKRRQRLDGHFVLAEYPTASGKMFDCSVEAQDNWDKLKTLFDLGLIAGNFQVSTFDRLDSYTIIDLNDLSGLIASVSVAVLGERTITETYIAAVIAAVDEVAAMQAAQPYLEL